jgi:hypothetical protein
VNAADDSDDLRDLLWTEGANNSTVIINSLITRTNHIPPTHFSMALLHHMTPISDHLVEWPSLNIINYVKFQTK